MSCVHVRARVRVWQMPVMAVLTLRLHQLGLLIRGRSHSVNKST